MSRRKQKSLAEVMSEMKRNGITVSVPNPQGDIAKAIRDEAECQDMAYGEEGTENE